MPWSWRSLFPVSIAFLFYTGGSSMDCAEWPFPVWICRSETVSKLPLGSYVMLFDQNVTALVPLTRLTFTCCPPFFRAACESWRNGLAACFLSHPSPSLASSNTPSSKLKVNRLRPSSLLDYRTRLVFNLFQGKKDSFLLLLFHSTVRVKWMVSKMIF